MGGVEKDQKAIRANDLSARRAGALFRIKGMTGRLEFETSVERRKAIQNAIARECEGLV